MEWYHYVIIAAGAIVLLMLVFSLVAGKKELKKTTPQEKAVPPKKVETTAKVEPKPAPMKQPIVKEVPAQETAKVKAPEKDEVDKSAKYHISQNKSAKSPRFKEWRVRKEGSNKTIKYFQTQKEAIEFAENLAESAGSSIVIHKLDGSIRKQDYTKKD